MNERIKKIRKELDLTQQKFADRLGVKRNTVAQWELGINALTDQVLTSICREFNVNEEWLRYGTGEMFVEIDRENQLMIWAASILKDESDSFKRRFINMLMDLDEDGWEALEKIAILLNKKD